MIYESKMSLCSVYGYELMIETKGACVKVTVGLIPSIKRDWWAGHRWFGRADKMGLGLNVDRPLGWLVAYLGMMASSG